MLSNFMHRLLFVKEFSMGEGTTEIIGTRQMMVPLSFLIGMQQADPDKFYQLMNGSINDFIGRARIELGSEVYNKMEDLFGVFGLGQLKVIDFDKIQGKALVEIHQTPLQQSYPGMGHVCSITTGVLAGMFSNLLGKEVHAIVNKCMAKGADCCEFILK